MPLLLLKYWKPLAIVLAIIATFYAGYHVRGAFDQVAADRLLQAQIEANAKAQDEFNKKSAKLETELAAERIKSSDYAKRWSKINGKKHTVCMLSADTRQLLHDATSAQSDSPR